MRNRDFLFTAKPEGSPRAPKTRLETPQAAPRSLCFLGSVLEPAHTQGESGESAPWRPAVQPYWEADTLGAGAAGTSSTRDCPGPLSRVCSCPQL